MNSIRHAAYLTLAAALTLSVFPACTPSYEELRPDPSSLNPHDAGLQSKDLIEMTDKLAADVLKIPEIAGSPTKIVIVMKDIENHTSQPGTSLRIYVARMRVKLNTYARDRLAFVEERKTTARLQNEELGNTNTDPFGEAGRPGGAPPGTPLLQAGYVLKGEFLDLPRGATTYYLCNFQLTNLRTGEIVWENKYETRTLNVD